MDFLELAATRQLASVEGMPREIGMHSFLDAGEWSGGTVDDTVRWIREGYSVKGLQAPKAPAIAPRKRTRWLEEGDDLDLTRAWSGDPTPFSQRETGTKQGLRLEVEMFYSAAVRIDLIQEYGRWLAALASSYAAAGHDLEISAIYHQTRAWAGTSAPREVRTSVQLKRFGQSTDFVAWSPLFSPTGYRRIIFAMWSADARRAGYSTTSGYGGAAPGRHTSWGVTYDEATATMRISSPYNTDFFPADRMTRLAEKAFTA